MPPFTPTLRKAGLHNMLVLLNNFRIRLLDLTTMDPVVFSNDSFDRIYSTLLTAVASNQSMDIRITGSSDGKWCIIERVRIVAE